MSQRYSSAEEVEAERLRTLGPLLGPLYHALFNDVQWLHAKWKQFCDLYTSADTVDLLNETAGFFFRIVQDIMVGDAMLHIARLTDPERLGEKENLTLCRLPGAIENVELADRVAALVEAARVEAGFVRDWRNRHLAHTDFKLALDSAVQPLPPVSFGQMQRVLAALRAVINDIELHYWNSTTAFEFFIEQTGAESLTHYLSEGIKVERHRQSRWSRGEVLPEDVDS